MPARIYLVVAESERELAPTFKPSPGRPDFAALEVLTFDEFRRLDGVGFRALGERLAAGVAKIRSGGDR